MEYVVELRSGQPSHEWQVHRTNKADSPEGALSLLDGFRHLGESRHQVVWIGEDMNPEGDLFGQSPDGLVWAVHVAPPLETV